MLLRGRELPLVTANMSMAGKEGALALEGETV
jgi:hypothetical protein